MRAVWGLGVLLAAGGMAAQDARPARVEFRMVRPELASYTLSVNEAGEGLYQVQYAADAQAPGGTTAEVHLTLGAATVKTLFGQVRSLGRFQDRCASKAKGIAQTGIKTLTLREGSAADGVGVSCSWNYSDNKTVAALQDEFQGMAYTLDMGEKLKKDQRFDRLGLDRDSALLVDAVKDGRAQGVEAIEPVLKGLIEDQSLLERVRARATKLYEQGQLAR